MSLLSIIVCCDNYMHANDRLFMKHSARATVSVTLLIVSMKKVSCKRALPLSPQMRNSPKLQTLRISYRRENSDNWINCNVNVISHHLRANVNHSHSWIQVSEWNFEFILILDIHFLQIRKFVFFPWKQLWEKWSPFFRKFNVILICNNYINILTLIIHIFYYTTILILI